MKLLIDGYNLTAERWGMGGSLQELARQRDQLIALLADYRALRGHRMEVVFDGWRDGDPLGGGMVQSGIDITFSPKGVTADEVIRDRLAQRGGAVLVVSSDRRVRRWAGQAGVESIDSASFLRRIEAARNALPDLMLDGDPDGDRDAVDEGSWSGDTKKKGNPRRLSKRERGQQRQFKKL